MTVDGHLLPLAYVAMLWFFGTALVVALDHRARPRPVLTAFGVAACAAVAVVVLTAREASAAAHYAAFTAAFVIWAWHELAFLTGAAAGPRTAPLPSGAHGWRRFRLSAAAVLNHEVALALTLLLLALLTWRAANPAAAFAFALLFAMRLSTKLNIFLGVPNFAHELLPPRLAYLTSYFRTAPFNALMPLSLAAAAALTAWLGARALAAEGDGAVIWSLLAGLALLGLIEHLFLVLPLRDTMLWRWAIPAREGR